MTATGLTREELLRIEQVFAHYRQIHKAILYGSRATGNFKPFSDIDISLKGTEIHGSMQTQIECDFDDLMLPYKFDVSVYDKISNPHLIAHIDSVGEIIYKA